MKKAKQLLAQSLNLIFVFAFFLIYIKISRLGTGKWASLEDLFNGTALRPYIYRVLLPQTAKVLAKIIPITLSPQQIYPKVLQDSFLALNGDIFPREAFWILALIFLSAFGFTLIEKDFLADLGFSQEAQKILPNFLLILSLPFTVFFGYLYDLPQLFLFTFSLWLLYKEEWKWYLFLFILTTLNKETSILLTALFIFYYFKRLNKKTFYQILFWQLILYLSIRFSLIWVYRNNSGDIIYLAFLEHLTQYQKQPVLLLFTILLFFGIFTLIKKKWVKKNNFLKSAIIIPLLILPLYFIGGMPMEFRVFLEAVPILGVLIFDPEKLR